MSDLSESSLSGSAAASRLARHPMLASQEESTFDRFVRSATSLTDSLYSPKATSETVAANDPTSLQSKTGPVSPDLHLSAARMLEQQGDLEGAHQHYANVLARAPNNRHGLIGRARILHRLGKMNASLNAYQAALKRLGQDPVILNDYALCLARNGQSADAISALRSALRLKPDSTMYRNNLAAVLVQAGQVDDAVAILTPSHGAAVAHYNVAYLLNKRGVTDLAHLHFTESLRHDPSFAPARTMLDQVAPMIGGRNQRPTRPDRAAVRSPDGSAMPTSAQGVPSVRKAAHRAYSDDVLAAVDRALSEVAGQPTESLQSESRAIYVTDSADGEDTSMTTFNDRAVVPASAISDASRSSPSVRSPEIRLPRDTPRRLTPVRGLMAPLPPAD